MKARVPVILLADDDPGAQLLQSIALEGGGFSVQTASDGAEALAMYDRIKPDCLVLDVVMPNMSGFDVCREVRNRADGKHVPILILTSLDDLDSISTAYVAGATEFAQKGINPLLLVERVRFLLRAKELHDGLLESESRLEQAQIVARIGYWEFDSNGRTVAISSVALEILGLTPQTARSVKAFGHFVHPDDRQRVEDARVYSRQHKTPLSIDFRIVTPEGIERIVHMEAPPSKPTKEYQRRHRVATIQDITQLRRAEDHIKALAHFDPLTGLPNRAFLREQLALKLKHAARTGEQVILATLDCEQFNQVNHLLGSQAGDELLKAIGQRLQDSLGADSQSVEWISRHSPVIIARFSGDEFGIALTLRPATGHVANALKFVSECLRNSFPIGDQEITVGATLGAAVYPDDASDSDSLMRLADAALHQAKQSTRGGYKFYSAKMQETATRRLSLESDLRRAVERDQLELHFQPRVHADSLQPIGAEALLRWRHPDQGVISPTEFIPIAENIGAIIDIGEWALNKACECAADFVRRGTPLRIAVNVSAVQLQRAPIDRQVNQALRRFALDPALLEIEITEGILIDRPELARRALESLKRQNIRVALDDFGTGYSSLRYLRDLPIDYIKIDRSFVADLESNDSSAIVSAILTLARGLHLQTIAEGVETERQQKILSFAGCEELQGFLFARPMAFDELTSWLDEWRHERNRPRASNE